MPGNDHRSNVDLLYKMSGHLVTVATPEDRYFYTASANSRDVWPVHSDAFRNWATYSFTETHNRAPRPSDIRQIRGIVESRAACEADFQAPVHCRVAAYGERVGPVIPRLNAIVLDLANPDQEVVHISRDGWQLVKSSTYFIHVRGTQRLPVPDPVRDETRPSPDPRPLLATFRHLLNIPSEQGFTRVLSWMLAALRGTGPYPVLALHGPAHSGKTTAATMLRDLIDPARTAFLDQSNTDRQILTDATTNHVLAFDNIRRLSTRLASLVNQLASGASFRYKEPHTHREPIGLYLERPVLLALDRSETSRAPCSRRPVIRHLPLAMRSLTVEQPGLTPETERDRNEVWDEYGRIRTGLFTLLCEALATALRRYDEVNVTRPTRFPTEARWMLAAAPALGLTEDQVYDALNEERPDAVDLPEALHHLLGSQPFWSGRATELIDELDDPALPANSGAMVRLLHDSRETLEAASLRLFTGRNHRGRTVTIRAIPPQKSKIVVKPVTGLTRLSQA